jgi:hypothetical protein
VHAPAQTAALIAYPEFRLRLGVPRCVAIEPARNSRPNARPALRFPFDEFR